LKEAIKLATHNSTHAVSIRKPSRTEVSRTNINDDVRTKITTAFQKAREQGPTVAEAKKSRAITYTAKSLMESAQPILDTLSSSRSTHRRDILSHDIGEVPVVKDLDSLFQECLVALGFPELKKKDERLQMSPKQKQSFWSFKEKK
jgi:thioredoxin-like negative regulator of GroEL